MVKLTPENLSAKVGKRIDLKTVTELSLPNKQIDEFSSFSKLEALEKFDLKGNHFKFTRQIERLFDAPNLKELDFTGSPVCKVKFYREFVIARCPNLVLLDQKEVSEEERTKAKKMFINEKGEFVSEPLPDAKEEEDKKKREEELKIKKQEEHRRQLEKEKEERQKEKDLEAKRQQEKEELQRKKNEEIKHLLEEEKRKQLESEKMPQKQETPGSQKPQQKQETPKQPEPQKAQQKQETPKQPEPQKKQETVEPQKPQQKQETSKQPEPQKPQQKQEAPQTQRESKKEEVFQDSRSKMVISDKLTARTDLRVEDEPKKKSTPQRTILEEDSLFGESSFKIDTSSLDLTSLSIDSALDKEISKNTKKQTTKPVVISEADDLFSSSNKSSTPLDDDLFGLVDSKNSSKVDALDFNIDSYIANQKNKGGGLFD